MTDRKDRNRLALLSVTDKTGLVEFARGLLELGFSLLSSGGTARVLREAGLEVAGVDEFTGSPEILGGRVKTLHPRVHGGILARADHDADRHDLEEAGIPLIDLVVVNLYRFEEAVARFTEQGHAAGALDDAAVAEVIEQIDIGGPTMVRAAAKNAARVGVVVDPADYDRVLGAWRSDTWSLTLRTELAARAFRRVAEYDLAVDHFFSNLAGTATAGLPAGAATLLDGALPAGLTDADGQPSPAAGAVTLRYGENPHQRAFFLRGRDPGEASVLHAELRSGKALSFNNLLDAEAALELVKEFEAPAAVVIKHANPCGAAVAETLAGAFQKAHAGDPLSAFGGIVALNRPLDADLARTIAVPDHFFEVLVAPEIDDECLEILRTGAKWGKNLRVLACGATRRGLADRPAWTQRAMVGGVLVQERDLDAPYGDEVKTQRTPTTAERSDLEFAWTVVKHVHSNAIVLVRDGALVGAGAGQMSRVDSVEIAVKKAGERADGSVLGSDAFFPFRDGVDAAARAGVTAVIQPGGSRRDAEVITACDEAEVAMVFTGARHFLH